MKRKPFAREKFLSSCNEVGPEDGIDPRIGFRNSRDRQPRRKALQLCEQVARELMQVLGGTFSDSMFIELRVEAVVPAPNASHLLVTVSAPGTLDPDEVRERLRHYTGRLRAEVATSIHRKRVPELSFQVLLRRED